MASTASTNNRVWECGAAVSVTSTAGTKTSIQSNGVVPDFLEQRLHGADPILSAMAENPTPSPGRH